MTENRPSASDSLAAVPWRGFLVLACIGIALRLGLFISYAPVSFGDTPSYMRLATALQESGLDAYDGTRVPGYPAFLAILDQDPQAIWLAQMALGWGISMLLFSIGWKTSGSATFGFLVGLLANLLPGPLLFEANLLSETLTAFLVVLSLVLLVALDRAVGTPATGRPVHRGLASATRGSSFTLELLLALALGAVSALAGLVRPLFFVLPVWMLLFVWLANRRGPRHRIACAIAFSLGPILMLGGWLAWVYQHYAMISPTTMGGYHLVQHTGGFFEYLPDEVAPIRDTYLKYREAQIAARGTQTNAIWDAIPEMSEVSGLSFFGLSAELQRLSLRLIVQHPGLYMANVIKGWIDFWKAPVYWDRSSVRWEWLGSILASWTVAGRAVTLLANAAFLICSGLAALSARVRRRMDLDRYILAAGGLVWLCSVVQTLVDHGDNPRFLVPLQALLLFVVLRAARNAIGGKKELGDA